MRQRSGGQTKDRKKDKTAHTASAHEKASRVSWSTLAKQAKSAKKIRDAKASKLRLSHSLR